MANIMVVEDDNTLALILLEILKDQGHNVFRAPNGQAALDRLNEHIPDLVLQDLKLPDMSGMQVAERIKKHDDTIQIVILTAHGDVKSAVQAMKLGVYDYLNKPFDNEELIMVIDKALKAQKMNREMEALRQQVQDKHQRQIVLGESMVMKTVLQQVKEVANTNLTIVLQGESGTGKEVISHLIHQYSPRKDRPFVAVDCGSLPDTLVESELFGYEKGAFTGADRRKLGQFELANGGTLFLDEIGNLPLPTQAKLLRVLQERKIQHLGGKQAIDVDVRVVTATNVILEDAVKKGFFREDLYYRITEFVIKIPPLRDRKEDIPIFAQYFVDEANKEFVKNITLSPLAIESLQSYTWPGNIRELRNVIKRGVLMAESEVTPQHLQISVRIPASLDTFVKTHVRVDENNANLRNASKYASDEVERQMILDVLKSVNNNKQKAAEKLGVSRRTLYNKLKALNIDL
ncbi:MAG: sigma-54 dependent transcriptional regulator [Elusimicrobiota bacterium]